LAKIYGLYLFEKTDPVEKYILILMRNVNGYPTSAISRKYDLKGSTYERITIKENQNVPFEDLHKYGNLKDQDFVRFDKKINVSPEIKGNLFEQLKTDAMFLSEIGVIDYSFIVYLLHKEDDDNYKTKMSQYHCLKSIKEDKIWYHFGIIDYLNPYTVKKSLSKLSKKLVALNPNLDCSVQEPVPYAERFIRYMQEALF